MVNTKGGSKKQTKKKQKEVARKKAQEKIRNKLEQNRVSMTEKVTIGKTTKEQPPQDSAPFPTENNGNSHDDTYLSVASNLTDMPVKEKLKTTSFHIVRDLLEKSDGNDDDTVVPTPKTSRYSSNIRLSSMISVPSKDISDEEAPFEAIRKMNGMLKSLFNKIPSCKIGKWKTEKGEKPIFLHELPEDVDIAEQYIYDYSRFTSPGQNCYFRINICFDGKKTSEAEILSVIIGFKIPRVQWMNKAHSDSLSPVEMGFFTGSVRAMAESTDFLNSFIKMFQLKHLGLWWAYPKSESGWTKDMKKWALHYEMDRGDVEDDKNDKILAYFSKNSSHVDNNFFGTAMSVAPIYRPYLDDEIKMKINRHTKKQLAIGSNIKSISLGGTQILNWADSNMESTLHRELMMIESIFEKKVISSRTSNNNGNKFKGRLFYAIIPNQRTKATTFYFSKANTEEA